MKHRKLYVMYLKYEGFSGRYDWHQLHFSLKSAKESVRHFKTCGSYDPKRLQVVITIYKVEREAK